MSTFIQIPNRINQLTKNSKLNEIFIYAAIRSQIKDNSYTAAYPQEQLAALVNETDRTIRTYIETLEASGLIIDITKEYGIGEYAHNVYHFDYLDKEYFAISPDFIKNETISSKLKGFLLLIKTHCVKGTNYIPFNSQAELASILNIGKNQISKYLKELQDKGMIEIYDKTLFLPDEYFLLYWANGDSYKELKGKCYKAIYDYCKSQKVVPPYKATNTNDMSIIASAYLSDPRKDITKDLIERCPNLPKDVSLSYFTKALTNKKATTYDRKDYIFILD